MSKTSKAAKLHMITALTSYADSGAGAATIVFYDDTMPATTEDAANDSAKLVTLTLPEPCFKEVTVDYVELYPSDTATVIKTGTATWARLFNGAGASVMDLVVGTDIALANTSLAVGGTLNAQSIKLQP